MQIRTITEDYIKDLMMKGTREDGRALMDYRKLTIIPKTIPNAEGSAEVQLGNTRVLAGVKLGVGSPMPDKPKEGNMMTSAELLPLASESYDTGPPTPEAIELARVIDRGIRAAGMIDMASLFIEDEKVWEVFIDLYILNYDGNLFDAGTIAAVAALGNARMPKYEEEKVIREGNLGKLKLGNSVASCTFAKIADRLAIDPDGNEEAFMESRLTITTDDEKVRAMQKGLGGAFTTKELETLVDITFDKSKELRRQIDKANGV